MTEGEPTPISPRRLEEGDELLDSVLTDVADDIARIWFDS